MTEVAKKVPDLTPPVGGAKKAAAPKEPNAPKAPKEPKPPKVAKEPKPPRVRITGPYGYHKTAVITVLADVKKDYKGQRAAWFERVKASDGKTVAEFNEANKGILNGKGVVDAPGGWLRFYALDGAVKLTGGPVAAPVAEVPKAEAATTA